jgi:beta-lysine 5,6-aminomutase alpha subunit
MSDRALAIENARYIFKTMAGLGGEIEFKSGGIIQSRAKEVLEKAAKLLERIEKLGLFGTLEQGIFADIKRMRDGGKGLSGVVKKEQGYFNPFIELMKGGSEI